MFLRLFLVEYKTKDSVTHHHDDYPFKQFTSIHQVCPSFQESYCWCVRVRYRLARPIQSFKDKSILKCEKKGHLKPSSPLLPP